MMSESKKLGALEVHATYDSITTVDGKFSLAVVRYPAPLDIPGEHSFELLIETPRIKEYLSFAVLLNEYTIDLEQIIADLLLEYTNTVGECIVSSNFSIEGPVEDYILKRVE